MRPFQKSFGKPGAGNNLPLLPTRNIPLKPSCRLIQRKNVHQVALPPQQAIRPRSVRINLPHRQTIMTVSTLGKIAGALGVPVKTLFDGEYKSQATVPNE